MAAGIIPIIFGAFIGKAFDAFLIYNAALLLLLLLDIILTPGKKNFIVQRICEVKFSLGSEDIIIIRVRNNSSRYVIFEIRDEVPRFFKIINSVMYLRASPHNDNDASYRVIPEKRGEHNFGKVNCRYKGVLGLCLKTICFNLEKSYKVYPNLNDLKKYSLASLNKNQLIYGVKKTKSYSLGTEFESMREYTEGDDYRKINWLATARGNKLIVNNYEPEKNQQVFILLDSSRVMNSEINFIKKLDYAINSAFLLADVCIKKGDNTGLMVFDSEVRRYIKTGKGISQFQLIAEYLYNVEENIVSADYRGALTYLNEHQKRRSLLCIFTELFNSTEALELAEALKSISRRHIPLVITIKDMRIYNIIYGSIKSTEDIYIKSAAIKLNEERDKIKKVFANAGIACLDIPPDKLSIEVVNKYLSMKAMMQV